ncbi:MAG: hypothetical protein IPF69_06005 [Chitinophagaceae bacterium]|nr:hypothetical protein [Chitinophagaceae bacterium]MBK9464126.1 hypothetical protein [Chitinophagaceae bacterium]HQW43159.1 c-type cytochrome [Chitinophagaceae bacterium]
MKNKYVFISILAFATGIIVLNACRHEILDPVNGGGGTGGGNPLPASTCSPDSVYFVNQVMPLISSNCTMSGCHDNITHADGVNLTTYAKIMQYVIPGNAANSKLYKVVIKTNGDRMPPPPMPVFTTAQKALLQKWINQGAKNNSCVGSCDTTVFTYSGAVKPIMDAKCTGCHNPGNLGGNIDVSTYTAVRVVALNGKLYGSVAHQAGYSPMPKNSAKLSDCEIRQIQKWVTAGSLNN